MVVNNYPVVRRERAKERLGYYYMPYTFPINSGQPRSYLEFPNHLLVKERVFHRKNKSGLLETHHDSEMGMIANSHKRGDWGLQLIDWQIYTTNID